MTEMGELSVEDQLRRERDWAREERDLLAAELASNGSGEYIVANQKLAKQIHTLEDERDQMAAKLKSAEDERDDLRARISDAEEYISDLECALSGDES